MIDRLTITVNMSKSDRAIFRANPKVLWLTFLLMDLRGKGNGRLEIAV